MPPELVVVCTSADYLSLSGLLAPFGIRAAGHTGEIPNDPCILVARTPEAAMELASLGAPIVQVSGDDLAVAAAVVRAVIGQLRDRHQQLASYEAGLLEQITDLRATVEHERHLLADMRQALSAQALALSAVIEPDGSVRQDDRAEFLIPTAMWGLSKIDLHFTPGGGTGTLAVRIEDTEAGTVAGEWQMPYSLVADGWNAFGFPAPLANPRYRMKLIIEWNTESDPAPPLSMSASVVLPSGEAYTGTAVDKVRLPAMRIYRGPAGSNAVEPPYWLSAAAKGEL